MVGSIYLFLILAFASLQMSLCTISQNLAGGCFQKKGCLFKPANCVPFDNCTYFMSYAVSESNDSVTIELLMELEYSGPSAQQEYVAIGLSYDEKMGGDAVTFCVHPTNDLDSIVRLGYNPQRNNVVVDSNPTTMISDMESSVIGSTFVCRFNQKISPDSGQTQVRRLDQAYYIFLVGGYLNGNDLSKHITDRSNSKYPFASLNKIIMTDKDDYSKNVNDDNSNCLSRRNRDNLIKAHGILMLFGWWVFVATAILFARYFKTYWSTQKFYGKHIWFNSHRLLNGIGVLMIATGFICIFIATCGEWVGDEIPRHAITGMTAAICAFVQPIVAALRCHPGTSRRPIFVWIHRSIGLVGFCCACATLWFATYIGDVGLHTEHPRAIMIFYWVVLFIVIFTFELLITVSERIKHPKVTVEMHMDNHDDLHPIQDQGIIRAHLYTDMRIVLLGIFFGLALAIVIALSCFVGLY